jgi:AAA domain
MSMFKKAKRFKSKLRMAIIGPTGSGKTYSSLKIAKGLGSKIALIDTEHGSASKYSHICDFDVVELDSFNPERYIRAIEAADKEGYEVLVIDSLSHAWMGKDGALELVDNASKRSKSGNSFTAWREVTPLHNRLVEAILASKCHVIVTMRAKMEYIMEEDSRGKKVPRKVGMAPIQRDGMEYEFDIVCDLDLEKNLIVTKTRCDGFDGRIINKPNEQIGKEISSWLMSGEDIPLPPASISNEQLKNILFYWGALVTHKYNPVTEDEQKKWDFAMKVAEKKVSTTEDKANIIIDWLKQTAINLNVIKEVANA